MVRTYSFNFQLKYYYPPPLHYNCLPSSRLMLVDEQWRCFACVWELSLLCAYETQELVFLA